MKLNDFSIQLVKYWNQLSWNRSSWRACVHSNTQDVQITNGVYLYVYPLDTQIFEIEEEAQVAADELNV